LYDDFLRETQEFLRGSERELNVVAMPDFFLDRFISLDYDEKTFCKSIGNVTRRKGGSIDRIRQTDTRGGNAVNTASALAALGANVTPIICTNGLGAQLLRFYLKHLKLDLSHLKMLKEPSVTTAIEFKTKSGRINVMLRDVGDLARFGPHDLNDEDFEIIKNADYVCVFNWAGTKQFGTELARTVFSHVRTKGKGKTYYDTADPIPNAERIPQLVRSVLKGKNVNILSVNENEAICFASLLCNKMKGFGRKLRLEESARKAARILATHLSARIDLHATSFSAAFTGNCETVVPAFRVPVLRATGAGDAWNAGNILGDANELSEGARLTLANAVAAYYISSPKGTHPTKGQLMRFLTKIERK
jgi:ribokinase